MKNRKLLTTAICLAMCLAVSIGLTVAYFTDYEAAKGGAVLHLSGRDEIEEEFDGNDKLITVTNTSDDDVDMVVRVLAYGENLQYEAEKDGDWIKDSKADNIWYYHKVLKKGESTSQLRVKVKGEVKADAGDAIDFEVTVVDEGQRAVYTQDSAGNNIVAVPAGWNISSISAE